MKRKRKFNSEEYWDVKVVVKMIGRMNWKLITEERWKNIFLRMSKSKKFEQKIGDNKFVVKNVKKQLSKHAYPPFTTSTLQQSAYNGIGFTSKRTMSSSQLYQAGYITYENGLCILECKIN